MPNLKIAALGAGSFVFGPSVLKDVILDHKLAGVELALMDPAKDVVELMAAVGRRMAREMGVDVRVTAHADRDGALDGAAFVVCSAAREVKRRFAMDRAIAVRHDPSHLLSEFGGIAGISCSLRQVALIEEVVADMRRLCPGAWLLDAANPLPRVCQAAYELGVKTAGFCSVSLVGYEMIGRILDGERSHYPFAGPRGRYDATMSGTNHLTWVVGLRARAGGADLLPALRERVREGATSGNPRVERLLLETGYLITSGDGHSADFLPPSPLVRTLEDASHGSAAERERRLAELAEIAQGRRAWDGLFAHESWEKPIDLVAAMAFGRPTRLHALNLVNAAGQVPQLPRTAFVETAAAATADGPVPDRVDLPSSVAPYCAAAAEVTETIVRAALSRRRDLVHRAAELDPTILDKRAGIAALDECLAAHADVLPRYA